MSAKFCRTAIPNLLEKRNLTAIPLILIPEYSQSNATLGLCSFLGRAMFRDFFPEGNNFLFPIVSMKKKKKKKTIASGLRT